MIYLEFIWTFCIFSTVISDTIPSSPPSLDPFLGMEMNSYVDNFVRHVYEGDLMKFRCSVYPLGNPPITWTWFCGDEQMRNVTFERYNTYMNFTATLYHDGKSCFCRAKSHSTVLFYDYPSRYRYVMRVFHSPKARPMIYPLSPTTVQSGEYINIKCNLTTLGYPQISWRWICDNIAPQNGVDIGTETYLEIKATARHNRKVCRCRGISSSIYIYDEVSDPVIITVFSTTNVDSQGMRDAAKAGEETQCITDAAFGTTTGLLVAFIVVLSIVLLIQCMRRRKGNSCSGGNSGKIEDQKESENKSQQNPLYVNDESYEVLKVNKDRI